jgi:enoyl-CoA hydratase
VGEHVRRASADPDVRGVVLTGAGHEVFAAGADLRELDRLARGEGGAEAVLAMMHELGACEACDVPVVAAVQGDVLGGGCELLLLCDLAIAERHARLSFRHARMGLVPAWGGLTRLVERAGPLEAARLLYTAEAVSADDARRLGVVSEVVETGEARSRAVALVERVAEGSRASVAAMKRALRAVRAARRGDAIDRERAIFAEVWGNEDHLRAMRAFLDRK